MQLIQQIQPRTLHALSIQLSRAAHALMLLTPLQTHGTGHVIALEKTITLPRISHLKMPQCVLIQPTSSNAV